MPPTVAPKLAAEYGPLGMSVAVLSGKEVFLSEMAHPPMYITTEWGN